MRKLIGKVDLEKFTIATGVATVLGCVAVVVKLVELDSIIG